METCILGMSFWTMSLKTAVSGLAGTQQLHPPLLRTRLVKQILDDKPKQVPNSVLWTAGLGERPHLNFLTFERIDLPSFRVRVGRSTMGRCSHFYYYTFGLTIFLLEIFYAFIILFCIIDETFTTLFFKKINIVWMCLYQLSHPFIWLPNFPLWDFI